MEIKISNAVAKSLGENKLRALGHELRSTYGRDYYAVDLASLTRAQTDQLREWLEDLVLLGVRGPRVVIKDIDTWSKALQDAGDVKARTLQHFASILTEYLRKVAGHRLYKRLDLEGLANVAYYCNQVTYHPPDRSRDRYEPAYVTIDLMWIELGGRTQQRIHFNAEDAQGMTASEALARMGYFSETAELRERYLEETDRFGPIAEGVGKQFHAIGTGTDDLDGNPSPETRWSSYGARSALPMVRDGEPSKVVIDIFYESEKERRGSREGSIDLWFWSRKAPKVDNLNDDEAFIDQDAPLEQPAEIPVHPFCATFDLKRHLRLKIHVNYLAEYQYDETIADRLILPVVTKDLVSTLIQQSRIEFADIIAGKGGGVCVLLSGVPGVGKTLTAEVFAESSKRPLYSIQAAQLGINSARVEENLVRFLARGSRWNAVVLIDEADVYIRSRDRDMEHNAIVAAFLRVLEYQTSTLFMTTNLADLVDDAIASRCVARIDYNVPDQEQQADIWAVMNEVNQTGLSPEEIGQIVQRHPELTGRDIKQLVKLASLVSANHGGAVTPETVDFVSQFQPTKQTNSEVQ